MHLLYAFTDVMFASIAMEVKKTLAILF